MASGVVAMMPPSAETPIVRPVTVAYSSARNHVTANRRIARKMTLPPKSTSARARKLTRTESLIANATAPNPITNVPVLAKARAVPIYKHPGGQLHGSVEAEK